MAKQTNGLLGGYTGKVGPVVGYQWKGVWCVRSQPRKVHNPRTEAQQEHRAMFREEVRLAGKMGWAVNIGFKTLSDAMDMTAQNLFVKANQQAFRTLNGHFAVDYRHLQVSAGPVAPVAITEVVHDEHNVLTVKFEKNPLHLPADNHDNVYVWVWSPEAGAGYLANPVYRRMKRLSTVLPDYLEGTELHVYAFAQNKQGDCSNTAYGDADSGLETTEWNAANKLDIYDLQNDSMVGRWGGLDCDPRGLPAPEEQDSGGRPAT